MIHLVQPKNSRVCGQTVVAMAAGISVEESIELFGHNHGTKTWELVSALDSLNIEVKGKGLQRWRGVGKPPDYALLHILFHTKGQPFAGHWALNWAGIIHDPEVETPGLMCGGGRLASYLEIIPSLE
jgi:hypothetical protein